MVSLFLFFCPLKGLWETQYTCEKFLFETTSPNEFWEGEISNTIITKFTVFRLNFAFFSEPLQWRVFPGGEAKIWFFCQFRNSNFFSRKICLIEVLKSFPPPHRLFSCASHNLEINVKFIFLKSSLSSSSIFAVGAKIWNLSRQKNKVLIFEISSIQLQN